MVLLFNAIIVQIGKVEKISLIDILTVFLGKPGYGYNFNTKSLVTFEENLKFKGDIPLTLKPQCLQMNV